MRISAQLVQARVHCGHLSRDDGNRSTRFVEMEIAPVLVSPAPPADKDERIPRPRIRL